MQSKLMANAPFPKMSVPQLGGGEMSLGTAKDWQVIIVYRGLHCPLCKTYVKLLDELRNGFAKQGVEVALVSGDGLEKAKTFVHETDYQGDVGYDLSIPQMRDLGLYISNPRSPAETDRPFSEPGLFVVNDAGNVQIVDISNAPFARPDLGGVLRGITFIRGNDYPVRGTHI